jgi:hypothetical protein
MPPLYQTKLSADLSYDFYLFSQWALVPIKVAYTPDLTLTGVGRLFCEWQQVPGLSPRSGQERYVNMTI